MNEQTVELTDDSSGLHHVWTLAFRLPFGVTGSHRPDRSRRWISEPCFSILSVLWALGGRFHDLWTDRRVTLDGDIFIKMLNDVFSLFLNKSRAHPFASDLSVARREVATFESFGELACCWARSPAPGLCLRTYCNLNDADWFWCLFV